MLKWLTPSKEFRLWFVASAGALVVGVTNYRLDIWAIVGFIIFAVTAVVHKEYLRKWYIKRDTTMTVTKSIHYQDVADQIRNALQEEHAALSTVTVDKMTEKVMGIIKREL